MPIINKRLTARSDMGRALSGLLFGTALLALIGTAACVPYPSGHYGQDGQWYGHSHQQSWQQGRGEGYYYRDGYYREPAGYSGGGPYPRLQPNYYQ